MFPKSRESTVSSDLGSGICMSRIFGDLQLVATWSNLGCTSGGELSRTFSEVFGRSRDIREFGLSRDSQGGPTRVLGHRGAFVSVEIQF
jgi:hypothetical protein